MDHQIWNNFETVSTTATTTKNIRVILRENW